MPYTFDQIANPAKHGLKECTHCNGYGSSLKEAADRCTQCGGSGLVPISKEPIVKKNIVGQFVSVWDDGSSISTYCELDPSDGELFPTTVDTGDHGSLEREYFQTPDGDELEVCTTCHGYILKTAMNPGIGSTLNEEQVCSNSECESHE